MGITFRKAAHEQRGEISYRSGRVSTDTAVDAIEFSAGGLTSIVRQLPPWEDSITIGFRVAVSEGATTGNLTNAEWFFGLCSGSTRKYGQAGEYCIGNGSGTKARTLTQQTFAGVTPGTNYNYTFATERIGLWNANVSSNIGSNTAFNIPNCQSVWPVANPDNRAYGSKTWHCYNFTFRRSAANTLYVRWVSQYFTGVCISRDEFRKGVLDYSSDLTSTPFDSRGPWSILHTLAFATTNALVCQGSLAVDEATYGSFNYFNMAWNHATTKLLVRDFWVSAKYPQFYP